MAKKKITTNTFFSDLAAETGGEIMAGSTNSKYFVDCGNLALNYNCSGRFIKGGFPGGKIIEVFGPPSSSKSLLGNCFLAGCQRAGGIAIYLDCERSGNPEFFQQSAHVNIDELLTYYPEHIKAVEAKIITVVKAIRAKKGYEEIPIGIVWDSIGVSPSSREHKELNLPEKYTKEQFKAIVGSKEKPGERAREAGDALRKLCPFLDENNATLFIVNQTRQAIGVMFGSDEITAGGGKALPFYASLRLRTSAKKEIRDAKRDVPLGVNLRFKNRKNRSNIPGLETDGVQLFFQAGINPLGGLLTALKNAGRIEGKSTYKVMEPWADGKEYSFKASAVRNDVPLQALLDCPKLIDANTAEEVQEYVDNYKEALELSSGNKITEIDVSDDDDDGDDTLGLKGIIDGED